MYISAMDIMHIKTCNTNLFISSHYNSLSNVMLGVGNAVNAKLSDGVLVRHVELPL